MSEKLDTSKWNIGDVALLKALLTLKNNADVAQSRTNRRLQDVLWDFSKSGKPQSKALLKLITTRSGKSLLASLKAMFPNHFKQIDKGMMKHMLKRLKK